MYLKNYIIQTGKHFLVRLPQKVYFFFEYIVAFVKFKGAYRSRGISVKYSDAYPCLEDRLPNTPFDQHYTYHPAWAARILAMNPPIEHIDISSILHFGSIISAFFPVKFYDYRPAKLNLPGYHSDFADLKQLPFETSSIASLSCMHTIEHIGLGRYGDQLDVNGDIKAIEELKRVLAVNGTLLFVTPVGRPRVEFNAHRVYSFDQIIEYFSPLKLMEFSMVPDAGGMIFNADPELVKEQNYGCGCFWFKKL